MLHEHEIEIRVRYQETDAMGYVHHANYLTFFEMGRTELLRANELSYRTMEESGLFLVVVKFQCRYHRPARYDDLLRLKTVTTRLTAARVEHDYKIFRDHLLLTEAHSVLACVDTNGELQRIPDWLREDD